MIVIVAAVIAVLVGIYLVAQWLEDSEAKPETRGDYQLRYEGDEVVINGGTYRERRGLTSILFMGIDKDSTETEVITNRQGGQADFLRLVVIDSEEKKIYQIAIDRDTMTPITVLSLLGDRKSVRTNQISLSHGYGDGKAESSGYTVEAVSNLLMNIPIKYYVAMNLDGISTLNDTLGGVTVTLEDDFSHLDPVMTKGTTLTLVGDQAEIFVRSRRSVGVGTNEARMARQQQYVAQSVDLLNAQLHDDANYIGTLFDALSPYLDTNMSRAKMVNEAYLSKDYSREPLIELPGEHKIDKSGFMEFYVDQDALEQTVLGLFYKKMK